MQYKLITATLILILLNISRISAQYLIVNADTTVITSYENAQQDTIYIFYGPGRNGWPLEMKATGKFSGSADFTWYRYNPLDTAYTILEKTDTNVDSSILIKNLSGGYKLHIINPQIDTSLYFWMFSNDLKADLDYRKDCDELKLTGISGGIPFEYFDRFNSGTLLTIENGMKFEWQLSYRDEELLQWKPLEEQPNFAPIFSPLFSPPPKEYKSYRYTVYIHDSLGHTAIDTMQYNAIGVKANFVASVNEVDLEDGIEVTKGQAPFRIQLKNKSINAETYEWELWNRSAALMDGDTIWRTFHNFEPLDSIEYINHGDYTIKLKAIGRAFTIEDDPIQEEHFCIDSLIRHNYVSVYSSAIGQLPNVFTPNEDGQNDKFYFQNIEGAEETGESSGSRSIRDLEVHIFNRSGERVYEYTGDDDGWDGWDGRMRGKGQKVQPGVYYWVIKAVGYDGVQHLEKGFVHVFWKK